MKKHKWSVAAFLLILFLLVDSQLLFPVVTIKWARHAFQIVDDSSGQSFEVMCQGCHSADVKLKAALTKPYDDQSKLNHQQKYFKQRSLQLTGSLKYPLDKDIYLAIEGGRWVLVNGRERYKWAFAEDAVVLVDNQGRPAFIQTLKPIIKTKLPPTL